MSWARYYLDLIFCIKTGLLIQRDGVVEPPTPQSWSHWFKDCFSAERTIEKKCLEAMAPKWFDCNESDMLAWEAIRILDDVVESLICTTVKVSSFSETSNVKKNINVKKVGRTKFLSCWFACAC